MVDNSKPESSPRRRKVLLGLGGGLASALAGCSTSEPGESTSTGPQSSETGTQTTSGGELGDPVEPVIDLKSAQQNPQVVNPPPYGDIDTWHMFIRAMMTPYGQAAGDPANEYQPLLVEKTEFVDNKTWKITVADGYTWHNGKKVTAEDRYWKEKFGHEQAKALGDKTGWADIRLTNDKMTLELDTHEEQPASLFLQSNTPFVRSARFRWKKWAEKMADATTEKEANKIEENFSNVDRSLADWVGNGLFKIDSVNDSEVIYTPYEDHPNVDKQNIKKVRVPIANTSGKRQLIQNDKLDWIKVPPSGADGLMPDTWESFEQRVVGGKQFIFNWNNKHLNRRGMRRAFAYALDSKTIMDTIGDSYPVEVNNGQSTLESEVWLEGYNDGLKDKYIAYGPGSKPEKAAEELKKAGYSKNSDGTWVGPDGEALSLTLSSTSWWEEMVRTIVSQMQRVGIDAQIEIPENFDDIWAQPGNDWDMMTWFRPRFVNHPNATFQNSFLSLPTVIEKSDGSLEQYGKRPRKVTVPKNIGDEEVTGSGRELDLYKIQSELSKPSTSEQRLKDIARDLTWYWNYDMPGVMWGETKGSFHADTENYVWEDWMGDSTPDAWGARNVGYGLSSGKVHGKSK